VEAPRRRPGGRSARVRAAVLDATLEELAAVGYVAMSFEGIARRAGVHKTTVYRNWHNREDLIREALLARSEVKVPVPDTGSLRNDLVAFGKALLANITAPEYEAVIRAVALEKSGDRELARVSRDFWEERFRLARVIVVRAIARGELPEGTDPTLFIETLIGPMYLRLLITREPMKPRFVKDLVDLIVHRGTERTSS
jgi:AcrR family transcriptional regulator